MLVLTIFNVSCILDFDETAAFAFSRHLDLDGDAFFEFLAVGNDADAAVALAGDFLELLEGGHDGIEALFVEGAEAFVDEEDVDVHVGTIQGGEGKGQRQGDHEAFASREDRGASRLALVVLVEDEDGQLLVFVAAGELVAVGDLFEVDVGVVEQGLQDIGRASLFLNRKGLLYKKMDKKVKMDWRRRASIARLSIRKICCLNGSRKLLRRKYSWSMPPILGPSIFSARSAIFCRYWTCTFSCRNNQAIGIVYMRLRLSP